MKNMGENDRDEMCMSMVRGMGCEGATLTMSVLQIIVEMED